MNSGQSLSNGLALFLIAGLALGQTAVKPSDALLAADTAWRNAYTAKDLDKSVAFYDEKASMIRPNTLKVYGKRSLEKLIAAEFAIPAYKVLWHPNKLGLGRSGFGYTSGAYELSFKDSLGRTISDKGRYTTLWKKQADGAWKVSSDEMYSDRDAPDLSESVVE